MEKFSYKNTTYTQCLNHINEVTSPRNLNNLTQISSACGTCIPTGTVAVKSAIRKENTIQTIYIYLQNGNIPLDL